MRLVGGRVSSRCGIVVSVRLLTRGVVPRLLRVLLRYVRRTSSVDGEWVRRRSKQVCDGVRGLGGVVAFFSGRVAAQCGREGVKRGVWCTEERCSLASGGHGIRRSNQNPRRRKQTRKKKDEQADERESDTGGMSLAELDEPVEEVYLAEFARPRMSARAGPCRCAL